MLEQIGLGMLTGVGYSLTGWLSKQNEPQFVGKKFKIDKMIITVVSCAVVGGIAGYTNQEFNILIVGPMGIGVTKLVNLAYKMVKGWMKK